MAIIALLEWPTIGIDQYDRVISELGYGDEGEHGGIYHTAADQGGVHIVDVWESPEALQTFVGGKLVPLLGSLQLPPPLRQETYPVHLIVIPPDGLKRAPEGGVRVLFDLPGVTAEQYDQVHAELAAAGQTHAPGRLFHAGGPSPRGWFVLDVWDSADSAMAFGSTLMPLLEKAGIPTDIPPTIAPLHNTLIQPAAERARAATNQIAFAAPVLPGKEEQAQAFFAALRGPRNREFVASRAALGIRERTYCQHTPQGDMCIVTLQGENAAEAAGKIGAGNDDFTIWFAQQVLDIHGLDLRQPLPGELPQVIVDSGSAAEHNKAVVRRFFEGAMNRHDPNILDEVAAPEYVNYLPVASGPLDLAASKGSLQEFFNAFPDLRWVDEGMIAEGDLVASRYTVTGTHRGTLMGIPATGRQIALHGTSLHKLKNGKIVEDWPGFSPLELLEQLGASPSMVSAGVH